MRYCGPTPPPGLGWVCVGRLRLLASGLILLAACTRSPDSMPSDSTGVHLTDHYVKLLRARLTAKDPYQATVAMYCEQVRIMTLLTNAARDPLTGENDAVRLLKEATERAYTPADRPARDRMERALDGRVFDAQPGCDSLARAGVLGDTVMPRLKRRRF
jgi:hypothetical protein